MTAVRSVSTSQSAIQAFITALSHADNLVNQKDTRLPYIFRAYKDALELYQQVPTEDQSTDLLTKYFQCRDKFFHYSSQLMTDLIKPAALQDEIKEQLITHAETVLAIREKFLTPEDATENSNQSYHQERILHFKQDYQIEKAAEHWGYKCLNTPKDGNCLFNAIADQLKQNALEVVNPLHDEPHHALRTLAVKHIRENQDCYAVHIPENTTLNDYTTRLAQSGTWGDHLEIMAIVRELAITLVLIHDDKSIMVFKSQHANAIFYLGYEKNYHFVSLHKQDNKPRPELLNLITRAQAIEIGPYILHTTLQEKKKVSAMFHSESKKVVPATATKKPVLPYLASFFRRSDSGILTEDKSKQSTSVEFPNLIVKSDSTSSGPR